MHCSRLKPLFIVGRDVGMSNPDPIFTNKTSWESSYRIRRTEVRPT